MLLDLSASAGARIDAAVRIGETFADAQHGAARPFAVYGLHPDGWHHPRFHAFKEFDAAWDAQVRAHLRRAERHFPPALAPR